MKPLQQSPFAKPPLPLTGGTNQGFRPATSSVVSFVVLVSLVVSLSAALPPIEKVEIRERAFYVNGQMFFPIMAWLQDARNFPLLKECGMNATAGFTSSRSAASMGDYVAALEKAGLYGVLPFKQELKGHPALLGYIHDDEPDLTRQVNDAKIEPGQTLRLNPSTPLWKVLDGDLSSWSVLDPLEGASFTIQLPKPVTVEALGVALTISKGLPLAKEIVFAAGGKELLKATLTEQRGLQKFSLPQPATFQELTVKVSSATPGEQVWGSLGEIEAFDKEGRNVLLCPPRRVPRALPEESLRKYAAVKSADATRPLFMTLTAHFHPHFKELTAEQRTAWYPEYVKAADVLGYDIYPIYGWNKPEWIYLCHDATETLVNLAGPRPVYAWIETSKGGQWTGALENQKDVKPEHIRAEVWMSICRGATAIGYFTHIWKPQYAQFGVPEENRRALRQINDQITRLTPAILGRVSSKKISIKSSTDVKLDLMARQAGSGLYLFCVNYDERQKAASATIQVEGLAGGTRIEVVDETRSLQAQAGAFTDEFPPLAVHIYRIGN
jgi:hypothetical protein